MVRIKFSAVFHQIIGSSQIQFQLSSSLTLKELIQLLIQQYPELESRLLEGGKLRRFVNIFLNGQDIRMLQGLDTLIQDRDELAILPAVVGG